MYSKPCGCFTKRLSDPSFFFSSLEPPEINPEPQPNINGGVPSDAIGFSETFRHSGWAHNRALVYAALKRTMQSIPRICAFTSCGAFAYVYQTVKAPFEYRLGGSSCRDRFCVPCASDRSRVLATNIITALDGQAARFLTLTLRTNDGPLSTQIDRLFSCFAALRQRDLWKHRVDGGCAFIEVKWSPNTSAWNVHVHCLVQGLFLPQRELSRAWFEITGDSYILDIRAIKDPNLIARYVAKYVSKPLNGTFVNRPVQLDDLVKAMRGRRLCFTFGTWRGIKLTQSPEPGEWINLGSFHELALLAREGDPDALQAIAYIAGDRTPELLASPQLTRAPPLDPALHDSQLHLLLPVTDNRF